MKIKFVLLLTFTFSLCYGQNYFDDSSVWHQRYDGCAPNICNHENYQYYVNGDTLINNISYLKIYKAGTGIEIVNFFGTPDTTFSTFDEYYAGIREEDHLVYHVRSSENTEALLYNFDWDIGDTIQCWSGNCIVVDSIGTINFGNDERKHFFLSGTGIQSNELIEGIGFGSGLFRVPFATFEWGGQLICYRQNENVISLSTSNECDFITNLDLPNRLEENISIFPNPVVNELAIEIEIEIENVENDYQVKIFNLNGMLVKEYHNVFSSQNRVVFDLTNLNSGIHFLTVQFQNSVQAFKFLKID